MIMNPEPPYRFTNAFLFTSCFKLNFDLDNVAAPPEDPSPFPAIAVVGAERFVGRLDSCESDLSCRLHELKHIRHGPHISCTSWASALLLIAFVVPSLLFCMSLSKFLSQIVLIELHFICSLSWGTCITKLGNIRTSPRVFAEQN